MGDDKTERDDSWRKEGTCGACSHFRSDFGAPPELYAPCKMYLRTGSRSTADYACPEFKPMAGFDEKIVLERELLSSSSSKSGTSRSSGSGRRNLRAARRRQALDPGGRKVIRRRADDGSTLYEKDTKPVSDDLIAALLGSDGDGDEPGGASMDRDTLKDVLLDVIESFIGVEDVEIGDKWQGGTLTIQPADPELKPQVIEVETFFHKIVMVRDRLRVMEQKINGNMALSDSDKIDLQQYISRIYGSLTSFNVLFKFKEDKFSSR